MHTRIENLMKSIAVARYPLCIEKSRLLTESFKKSDGEPMIVRRAKAHAHVLDHISIFIEDGQLIAGNAASQPMGLEFDFYAGLWSREEIESLKASGYDISKDDMSELLEMRAYWEKFNPLSRMGRVFDDELWSFMQSGIILPPWKDKEQGPGGGYAESGMGLGPGFYILTVDFEKVLQKGLSTVIAEAEKALMEIDVAYPDYMEKWAYLQSVIIAQRAVIRFAGRFADLAEKMAIEECNPVRKRELKRIGAACHHVPANPARTFFEAMQSFWFIFLMTTPSPTASMGRFDQYMFPYFQKDLEADISTTDEVLDLLQCLRIKDMHINRTSGKLARKKNAGMAKWHNMTIGGVHPATGEDATNGLSYLILDAALHCPVPHHTITVRVHEDTPEELMLKALEVVRTGIGMPAFVGDRSYIEYLQKENVPLVDARNYSMGGCIDATIAGKSRIAAYGMFIIPKILEITMNNGVDPRTGFKLGLETGDFADFDCFDDFLNAFKEQLNYSLGLHAKKNNIELQVYRDLYPDPVRSSLMHNGIKEGRSLLERNFLFENVAVMNPVGMINVIDSLAAVKKVVFDEHNVTQTELMDCLKSNWGGEKGRKMRDMFLSAPKYGNNDDSVDTIARDIFDYFAKTAVQFGTYIGGTHKPTGVSISAQWPGGELTGATPDGRLAGECLADGTVSAMRGMDTHGPTAVILSASKIDQAQYQASLMNMKFHPSSLKTTEDLRKLSYLIRTYFSLNGKHIQFNVVNKETLEQAQKRPDRHKDLIVRIAGYSAYFIQLGAPMQNEIIKRTEHVEAA